VKLMTGRERDVPNDAAVLRPVLESRRGLAVAQTLHPTYSLIDTYHMVAASIDEAVRRLVSVGAKLDEIGGVDNFCWPNIQYDPSQNPDGRYKAAQLVRANWALRDMCLAYGIPLLSGKDSMYVDGHLQGRFGERHKVSGLPTMQFTATGVVPDIVNCLTLEAKMPGDSLYLIGTTADELGGSEYYDFFGYVGLHVPRVDPQATLPLYGALEQAIASGLLASCHGIYRGGLGVHAAWMAFASGLGLELDLAAVPRTGALRDDQILFSESCGRFLVTVSPEKRKDFEDLFHGKPCARLGEVTREARLNIRGIGGDTILDEALSTLKQSWKGL
jgi:phosphoribosylformylglycinamidine synthase subunit PurSL